MEEKNMSKSTNKNLSNAKRQKMDEFYTQYKDIEKEVDNYKDQFKGMVVYCNCDNPEWSNFPKYFIDNFHELKLKKLIVTFFDMNKPVYKLEYNGTQKVKTPMEGQGDFHSDECIEILKDCDIVCTNPPFSKFRNYVAQLVKYDKKFLILGNQNAITYKETFSLLKNNKMWLGYNSNKTMEFKLSNDYLRWNRMDDEGNKYGKVPAISWFTNMNVAIRGDNIVLDKTYNPIDYPTYDNYDAINVDKVIDIPIDYMGVMGVPITFMNKHNPDQFEIVKFRKGDDDKDLAINKKCPYFRILIKRKPIQFEIVAAMTTTKVDDYNFGYPYINGIKKYARILIKRKPIQFEILGIDRYIKDNPNYGKRFTINGKEKYARILIKRTEKEVNI